MFNTSEGHNSFVLRIWWENDTLGEIHLWRGWVQHAASGEHVYVQTVQELLEFIEGRTGKLEVGKPSPGTKNTWDGEAS